MAVKTKKYISKGGRIVRAVKVSPTNFVVVKDYLAKAPNVKSASAHDAGGPDTNQKVRVHLEGVGIRVLRHGDYVFKVVEDGKTDTWAHVLKGADFEEKYTEVK